MEKFIYRIGQQSETELFDNLVIKASNPIQDDEGNNIIINKLGLLNSSSKIFIETDLIKVSNIDYINNKIILELDEIHQNFFNLLDLHCSNLLIDAVNENSVNDLNINIKSISNKKFNTISYKSILDDNSNNGNNNNLKLKIFSNTTIKLNGCDSTLSNINVDSTARLVLGLDQILLLINFDSLTNNIDLEAKTKVYCYFMDTHQIINFVNEQRENITEWNFSSINPNKIFKKANILETDNTDFKTDMPKMYNFKNDNISESSTLSNMSLPDMNDSDSTHSIQSTHSIYSEHCDDEHNNDICENIYSTQECQKEQDELNVLKKDIEILQNTKVQKNTKQQPNKNNKIIVDTKDTKNTKDAKVTVEKKRAGRPKKKVNE